MEWIDFIVIAVIGYALQEGTLLLQLQRLILLTATPSTSYSTTTQLLLLATSRVTR